MEQRGTCEQWLEAAFVSLAPQDLEGLGGAIRGDPPARRRYEQLVEVDLALAQTEDAFAVLGPLEARIATSYESLSQFFSPAAEAAEPPLRTRTRVARWALAAAAVLLAVLLPVRLDQDAGDIETPGIWTPRGDRATYLRPYCMDSESGRLGLAVTAPGVAVCAEDDYLVLTYALRGVDDLWLHAAALPPRDEEPVWIVPNPVHEDPMLLEPADRPAEAWPPVDLTVNYRPGTYQVAWAACAGPIPWTDWADAAEAGAEGIAALLEARGDCEGGTWILVVGEVAP